MNVFENGNESQGSSAFTSLNHTSSAPSLDLNEMGGKLKNPYEYTFVNREANTKSFLRARNLQFDPSHQNNQSGYSQNEVDRSERSTSSTRRIQQIEEFSIVVKDNFKRNRSDERKESEQKGSRVKTPTSTNGSSVNVSRRNEHVTIKPLDYFFNQRVKLGVHDNVTVQQSEEGTLFSNEEEKQVVKRSQSFEKNYNKPRQMLFVNYQSDCEETISNTGQNSQVKNQYQRQRLNVLSKDSIAYSESNQEQSFVEYKREKQMLKEDNRSVEQKTLTLQGSNVIIDESGSQFSSLISTYTKYHSSIQSSDKFLIQGVPYSKAYSFGFRGEHCPSYIQQQMNRISNESNQHTMSIEQLPQIKDVSIFESQTECNLGNIFRVREPNIFHRDNLNTQDVPQVQDNSSILSYQNNNIDQDKINQSSQTSSSQSLKTRIEQIKTQLYIEKCVSIHQEQKVMPTNYQNKTSQGFDIDSNTQDNQGFIEPTIIQSKSSISCFENDIENQNISNSSQIRRKISQKKPSKFTLGSITSRRNSNESKGSARCKEGQIDTHKIKETQTKLKRKLLACKHLSGIPVGRQLTDRQLSRESPIHSHRSYIAPSKKDDVQSNEKVFVCNTSRSSIPLHQRDEVLSNKKVGITVQTDSISPFENKEILQQIEKTKRKERELEQVILYIFIILGLQKAYQSLRIKKEKLIKNN